jgi:methylase of polypeptide subunit release factors
VILANLPYVPDKWQINQAAMAEPKIAIFGGPDGLEIYRKFFAQLHRFTWKPKFVLTESLPPQHVKLSKIAQDAGFKLYQSDDFIQVFTPV